ncbi:DUF7511 domain-containing protein [Natronomonas sp.]|uniref:DUF7511 domain-containing protein n=1 Tax=Natronomonas sp. TaxID=2184060 RepID=UPI003BEF24F3
MSLIKRSSGPGLLESVVVDYDDAPSECTIYPADSDIEERTTAWITAKEGSFCPITSRQ